MAEKRKQLRRCSACQKPGHNRARCPEAIAPVKSAPTPSAGPLKFFVHHVTEADRPSPHVLDLKKNHSTWHTVKTTAPASAETLFHTYHQEPLAEHRPVVTPFRGTNIRELLPEESKITETKIHFAKQKKYRFELRQKISEQQKKIGEAFAKLPLKKIMPAVSIVTIIAALITTIPGPALGYYHSAEQTKSEVASVSIAGFMALQNTAAALKNGNFTDASLNNQAALDHFDTALTTLSNNQLLTTLAGLVPIVHGEVANREKILLAGQEIALGNSYLLAVMSAATSSSPRLPELLSALDSALPNFQKANENLAGVNPGILPLEYQAAFSDFRRFFAAGIKDLESLDHFAGAFEEIIGSGDLRRYLVIFQNPDELRPTGGFLGSFALVEVKDGKIQNITVPPGGSYDLQGQLSEYVAPPTPLLLSNKRWEFQDANWFPDFAASAQKEIWFYAKSRGVTPDGVIAINAPVLPRLLSLIGGVELSDRGVTLDASNALPLIQKTVEEGPEKSVNRPKQILADAMPIVLGKIQNLKGSDLFALLSLMSDALEQKDIQAYFVDSRAEDLVNSYGWSGRLTMTNPSQDYLEVVNTNIQGQKSDHFVKQTINHQAVVSSDGSVIDTVTITREHTGTPGEKLYGAPNIDYLRIYVPEGSDLIAARGFSWPDEQGFRVPEKWYKTDVDLSNAEKEIATDNRTGTRITNEFGKTAFGNWVITLPGETSQVSFTYRLPFTLKSSRQLPSALNTIVNTVAPEYLTYQLVLDRQSGSVSDFNSQIIFPDGASSVWGGGTGLTLAKNGATIKNQPLIKNSIWSLIMKP